MKKYGCKRFFPLLICVAMLFGMTTTAYAAEVSDVTVDSESGTITIAAEAEVTTDDILSLDGYNSEYTIVNSGTIAVGEGTISNFVKNSGKITGGTFSGTINNDATITDGVFEETSVVNNNSYNLSGGTFKGIVTVNRSIIKGGTFSGTVLINNLGIIGGGTYTSEAEVIMNQGFNMIDGGTFECEIENTKYINGGTFLAPVTNNADILKGTFKSDVTNQGKIHDGLFSGANLINKGEIIGGTFSTTINNNATISGGMFTGTINNNATITDGVFEETSVVNNNSYNLSGGTFKGIVTVNRSIIKGGTFSGTVLINNLGIIGGGTYTSEAEVIMNQGFNMIDGGTFECEIENTKYINGGTFLAPVTNNADILKGTFKSDVTNQGKIHGGVFSGATLTNKGEIIGGTLNGVQLINFGSVKGCTYEENPILDDQSGNKTDIAVPVSIYTDSESKQDLINDKYNYNQNILQWLSTQRPGCHIFTYADGTPIGKDDRFNKLQSYAFNQFGNGEHITQIQNAKDATCTEDGYTGDVVCSVCGEIIEKGTVISAKGHHYENGKCTDCGALQGVLGDVDLDGRVNIKDATLIQQYCVDLTSLSEQQLLNADFDKDGRVSVIDATKIQEYLVELTV